MVKFLIFKRNYGAHKYFVGCSVERSALYIFFPSSSFQFRSAVVLRLAHQSNAIFSVFVYCSNTYLTINFQLESPQRSWNFEFTLWFWPILGVCVKLQPRGREKKLKRQQLPAHFMCNLSLKTQTKTILTKSFYQHNSTWLHAFCAWHLSSIGIIFQHFATHAELVHTASCGIWFVVAVSKEF